MNISTADLARALGLSPRRINQLAAEGVIVKTAPGQFDFTASARNYIAALREKAENAAGKLELQQERARLAKEQADGLALKNLAMRASLVPVEEVAEGWAEIQRKVRNRMVRVAPALRRKMPHLTAYDAGVVEDELRDALVEIE